MNNYFPALEAGNQLIANSQLTDDGGRDQRYPKYSNEFNNNAQAMGQLGLNQDQIEEVS